MVMRPAAVASNAACTVRGQPVVKRQLRSFQIETASEVNRSGAEKMEASGEELMYIYGGNSIVLGVPSFVVRHHWRGGGDLTRGDTRQDGYRCSR